MLECQRGSNAPSKMPWGLLIVLFLIAIALAAFFGWG